MTRRLTFDLHGPAVHRKRADAHKRTWTRFPGMNDTVAAAQRNRYGYAHEKRKITDLVARQCREVIDSTGWVAPMAPVHIRMVWHEPNHRRDWDNVTHAVKFVLDGMVEAGVIRGDSQRWIPQPVEDVGDVDPDNPGVTVTIETIDEEEQ